MRKRGRSSRSVTGLLANVLSEVLFGGSNDDEYTWLAAFKDQKAQRGYSMVGTCVFGVAVAAGLYVLQAQLQVGRGRLSQRRLGLALTLFGVYIMAVFACVGRATSRGSRRQPEGISLMREVLMILYPSSKHNQGSSSPRPSLIDLGPSSLLQTILGLVAAPTLGRAAHIPAIRAVLRAGNFLLHPTIEGLLRQWTARGSRGVARTMLHLMCQAVPMMFGLYHILGGLGGWKPDRDMQRNVWELERPSAGAAVQGHQAAVRNGPEVQVPQWHNYGSAPVTVYCVQQKCCCSQGWSGCGLQHAQNLCLRVQ